MTDADRLRSLLGEEIPNGSTAADTLFSEAQIVDLLDRHATVESAAAEGWDKKAAVFTNLVDVQEGDSKRSMSDLSLNAQKMADHFRSPGIITGSAGRTRTSRIARSGWQG